MDLIVIAAIYEVTINYTPDKLLCSYVSRNPAKQKSSMFTNFRDVS